LRRNGISGEPKKLCGADPLVKACNRWAIIYRPSGKWCTRQEEFRGVEQVLQKVLTPGFTV
jgi:hypothetical protein